MTRSPPVSHASLGPEARPSRLEVQVATLAEAVRVLVRGLREIPSREVLPEEAAPGERLAHELRLSRGLWTAPVPAAPRDSPGLPTRRTAAGSDVGPGGRPTRSGTRRRTPRAPAEPPCPSPSRACLPPARQPSAPDRHAGRETVGRPVPSDHVEQVTGRGHLLAAKLHVSSVVRSRRMHDHWCASSHCPIVTPATNCRNPCHGLQQAI